MADLDIRTATTQIEGALQSTIALAMQARLTVANAAALGAVGSEGIDHLALARLTDTGYVWRFDRYSTAAASATVIVPTDNPSAGRWMRTSSTASGGYLRSVKLFDGDVAEDQILAWLFGRVPAVVIVWDGEEYTPKSTIAGALYWAQVRFSIWAVSRNLRGEKQGVLGSQIAAEATADPGANRIVGDLRRYLAGSQLAQAGVAKVEINAADRVISSATRERGHVYRLSVTVYATLHNTVADDADNPATSLDRIDAEWAIAREVGADADYPDVYLTNGCRFSGASGLSATWGAGAVVVAGVSRTVPQTTTALAANAVTYRYVAANGSLTFVEGTDSELPTSPGASYVLLGLTATNGSTVIEDRLILPMLDEVGLTDQIDTTE